MISNEEMLSREGGGPSAFEAVPAESRHVQGMASCHLAAFPGEFTTLLGQRFLRCMYGYYVKNPDGISFVAVDQDTGRVIGLVKGGKPELRSHFARRYLPLFTGAMLYRSLVNRYFRRRLGVHFAQTFRNIGRKLHLLPRTPENPSPPADPPGTWSNLLSICTHPDWCGRGVGKTLMDAFRRESARRGYATMRLSVHHGNDAAVALYRKAGWKVILTCPNGIYFKRSTEDDT